MGNMHGPDSPHQYLYQKLAEALRNRILSGELPQGSPAPPVLAIARQMGVSRHVARLAYRVLENERYLVKLGSHRYQVRKIVSSNVFMKDVILEIVGIPLPTFLQDYSADLQNGILSGVGDLNAPLLIAHDLSLCDGVPEDLTDVPIRGLLLIGHLRREVLERYARLRLPCVLVDRPPEKPFMHTVCIDNHGSTLEAVRRLADLGHRNIAFVQYGIGRFGRVDPDSEERVVAFRRAIKKLGLPHFENSVTTALSASNADSISLRNLLQKHPRFTAVLATDTDKAQNVLDAALKMGFQVPRDLSIAAFHGKSFFSPGRVRFAGPCTDFTAMGRRAALILNKQRSPRLVERIPAPWTDGPTVGKCILQKT